MLKGNFSNKETMTARSGLCVEARILISDQIVVLILLMEAIEEVSMYLIIRFITQMTYNLLELL